MVLRIQIQQNTILENIVQCRRRVKCYMWCCFGKYTLENDISENTLSEDTLLENIVQRLKLTELWWCCFGRNTLRKYNVRNSTLGN